VRSLILYTPLYELWEIFESAIELSPLDAHGFFTLTMIDSITRDIEIEINPKSFWQVMRYFLYRQNKKVADKRRIENLRKRNK